MKWTAKLAVVAALAASAGVVCAWGQDAAVAQSANAVGVVKYTVPAEGGLTCISLPLNPLGTDEWIWGDTSLAEQLETGSSVYFWNGIGWDSYVKGKLGGWNAKAKNTVIHAGEAFFLKSPATSDTDLVVSLLGELPVESQLPLDLEGDGTALVASAVSLFPIQATFGESAMSAALPTGSTVYFWRDAEWKSYVKGKLGGWNNAAKGTTNFVGEGIFVKTPSDVTVTIPRPFDWD